MEESEIPPDILEYLNKTKKLIYNFLVGTISFFPPYKFVNEKMENISFFHPFDNAKVGSILLFPPYIFIYIIFEKY